MAKQIVSFSIDSSIMDQFRDQIEKGDMSQLIENFLKTYLKIESNEDISESMIDLIKEEEILLAQKIKINARLEKIARIKKKEGSVEIDFSK